MVMQARNGCTGEKHETREFGEDLSNIEHLCGKVQLIPGNLFDTRSLQVTLDEADPDVVVHLAAVSAPARSFDEPEFFFEVNTLGTLNLLETIRSRGAKSRVLLITSAEVYGLVNENSLPVTEEAPLAPRNPYAAGKAACHYLGYVYYQNFGLEIVELRPFNMIGPRQALGFVLPDFASQVAKIVRGRREPVMKVGKLSDRRDFTDVRDAVKAMAELIEEGEAGESYNICSSIPVPVKKILDTLLDLAGTEIKVEQDPNRLRPSKMPVLYGSHKKLRAATGWEPSVPLEVSIKDILDYWMEKTR